MRARMRSKAGWWIIQSRSDPDVERAHTDRGNHLAAILPQRVLSHDQIEDRWQNPALRSTDKTVPSVVCRHQRGRSDDLGGYFGPAR